MSTLIENKRTWRTAALILLATAMIGPWTYERVYVPPPEPCTAPNVQVEGDLYCGIPFSILWEFFGLLRWEGAATLLTGDIDFSQWAAQFLPRFLPLLLILPIFITLGLISRRQGARWQVLNVLAWALAALAGAAYLHRGYFRPYPAPWGNLLYVGVALAALVLELLLLAHSMLRTPPIPLAPQPTQSRSRQ
jgi:hypothetical protein